MQITEQAIDHLIETMDTSPEGINQFWRNFESSIPELTYYILNVDQSILTEAEYGQMVFAAMVVIEAFQSVEGEANFKEASEKISKIEDQNWSVLDTQKGDFREKLNIFFKDYPEEDLLAFVEDILIDDEASGMTPVGREVIFIKLKSVIDFLF
jgi:spore cortex formation protein SpoVR/YcgB (stage V sporulation)